MGCDMSRESYQERQEAEHRRFVRFTAPIYKVPFYVDRNQIIAFGPALEPGADGYSFIRVNGENNHVCETVDEILAILNVSK
jgi:hypothetical protein